MARGWLDRALRPLGLMRIQASSFRAGQQTRLTADWATQILTADQEARCSLTALRARSRDLANNNDYARRVVRLIQQNVIGPSGIVLQASVPSDSDALAEQTNQELERGWRAFGRLGVPTVDRRRTMLDVQNLAVGDLVIDGEVFLRKVRGFKNGFGFALQFLEPDLVDVWLNRPRRAGAGTSENEIRMGVEVDEWGAPVAYHLRDRVASPLLGPIGASGLAGGHTRIEARDILHIYLPLRANSTRGIPWLHTAMTRLHMLGGYEEGELTGARMASCMMGFFTSKTGDNYAGEIDKNTGAKILDAAPGLFQQLPEGIDVKPWLPNRPNSAYPEFTKRMLHGAAAGANVSYASLSGDLREVNFSSIRTGLLDERDGYRALQAFVIEHLCDPIFAEWLEMALLTGQVKVPSRIDEPGFYRENIAWQPRGWQWVDPRSDVEASNRALDSGLSTYADECASRGLDWREVFRQRKKENEYARELELELNRSTAGVTQQQEQNAQQGQSQ